MLISQAGSPDVKEYMSKLLDLWDTSGALEFIEEDILKIYLIIAGISRVGDTDAYSGLDWLRQFALHFLYFSQQSPLSCVIEEYETNFSSGRLEMPFVSYATTTTESTPLDVVYHILRLTKTSVVSLEMILDPLSHTPDPLDFRLR